jgi:hypothetical protein
LWDGCLDGSEVCSSGAGDIDGFWVEFDLGRTCTLDQARLFGDADGTWVSESWTLKHRRDASDAWIQAFSDKNAFGNQWFAEPLSGVSARYLRLEVNGNASYTPGRTQAREFEVTADDSGGMGDMNGDGEVSLADVRLQIQMLVAQVPPDMARADLDGNGSLTLADVRALINILVGA